MPDDLRSILERRLPAMFASALAGLEQKANADAGAAAALAAFEQPSHALLRWTGDVRGELLLRVARTGVTSGESSPQASFGHALSLTLAGANHLLSLVEREASVVEPFVRHFAVLCSAEARELLATNWFAFDLDVGRVPAFGDLRASVALGRPVLRDKPEFSLRIDYDELADASEQQIPLGALFMAGKVRIDGDVAKAMLLGMTLAQLP
jgi:SCP-2 sterol transfer family